LVLDLLRPFLEQDWRRFRGRRLGTLKFLCRLLDGRAKGICCLRVCKGPLRRIGQERQLLHSSKACFVVCCLLVVQVLVALCFLVRLAGLEKFLLRPRQYHKKLALRRSLILRLLAPLLLPIRWNRC